MMDGLKVDENDEWGELDELMEKMGSKKPQDMNAYGCERQ